MKSYIISAIGMLTVAGLASGQDVRPTSHLPIRVGGPASTQWGRCGLEPTSFAEERPAGPSAALPVTQIDWPPSTEEAPAVLIPSANPEPPAYAKVESRSDPAPTAKPAPV